MTTYKRGQVRTDVAAAARALLEERAASDAITPALIEELRQRVSCAPATARKHLDQQRALRRGELTEERRGGAREGAGREPRRFSLALDQRISVSVRRGGALVATGFAVVTEVTSGSITCRLDSGEEVSIIR